MTYVRYLVTDVQKAVDFYSTHLGFTVKQQFPAMAILTRGDLTLWLAGPHASASRPMPDGRKPEPGGWNRFVVETHDLAAMVAKLKTAGLRFRNDIVSGPGGQQIFVGTHAETSWSYFSPASRVQ